MNHALLPRLALALRVACLSLALVAAPQVGFAQPDASPGDAADSPATSTAGKADETALSRREALLASLTIFVLAVFLGFELITKVPPTLHTPLMSGSNAISGITIVGALLATGFSENPAVAAVGMLALLLATVNVVGGFFVTHRMLEMFKRKK